MIVYRVRVRWLNLVAILTEATTRDIVVNVGTLIAYTSSLMTLVPAGVDELMNGDVMDVEIEGLGKLSNPVKL